MTYHASQAVHCTNRCFDSSRFANATTGVTWGGQTYETSDGKVRGSVEVTTVPVSQGVEVHDTEVVMLTFE